jgi:hypothetical protein
MSESGTSTVGAQAEQFDRVTDVGETSLGGDLFGPPLDGAALDLHAPAADTAGEVMVVRVAAAAAVQRLAAGIPDGVYLAVLAEYLQMAVDSCEAHMLAATAQFRVNLLSAAETRQAVQHSGQRLGLPGTANARSARRGRGCCRRGSHTRTVAAIGKCALDAEPGD